MGLSNIIRRMALREKQSIREISRRTGLSRKQVVNSIFGQAFCAILMPSRT
jgi:hypothetical protein